MAPPVLPVHIRPRRRLTGRPHFVDEGFNPSVLQVEDPEHDELAALAATLYYRHTQADEAPAITAMEDGRDGVSPWRGRRRHAS